MNGKTKLAPILIRSFLLLQILLLSGGCFSVQLVSNYDEKFDEGLTALQKKAIKFLVKLERICQEPEGAYEKHRDWYDDLKTDLAVLQIRADARALNHLTSEQMRLLADSFQKMEAQHRAGFTPLVVSATRQTITAQFTSIFKLEVSKKRKE